MYIRQIVFLSVLFLASLPVTASAQSVVIIGLNSLEGDDEVARRVTVSLRASIQARGCRIDDRDVSLPQMTLVNDCNFTDIACLDRIANNLSVSTLIFGTSHRINTDTVQEIGVELYLFDLLEHRILTRYTGALSTTPSDEAIAAFTQAAAPVLTDCLHISPDPVPPVVATVRTDEDEDEPRSGPIDSTNFPELDQTRAAPASFNHEWAGWTLIGLGTALILADIPVWVRLGDLNSDPSLIDYRHRLAFGATGDACTNASAGNTLPYPGLDPTMATNQVNSVRSACSEGATLEIVQYVLPILGALVGATGATLLMTGVLVSPSVSTDRATLTVSGSF